CVRECVAVVGQLDLEVHRRAPDEIRCSGAGRRFADEAIVDLGAVHVVVVDRDLRAILGKVLEQRAGGGRVGCRIDEDFALFVRRFEDLGRGGGGLAGGDRSGGGAEEGPQRGGDFGGSALLVYGFFLLLRGGPGF